MLPADEGEGVAVNDEIYELTLRHLHRVREHEPSGLGVGVVDLDGEIPVLGILWTAPSAPDEARDISAHGGWREYMSQRASHGSSPQT
jgi:allophanate hydrolase